MGSINVMKRAGMRAAVHLTRPDEECRTAPPWSVVSRTRSMVAVVMCIGGVAGFHTESEARIRFTKSSCILSVDWRIDIRRYRVNDLSTGGPIPPILVVCKVADLLCRYVSPKRENASKDFLQTLQLNSVTMYGYVDPRDGKLFYVGKA
ncbi:MAG: hypothetical protein R3A10_11435 [Caldilineaceae bacterium]